VTALWPLVFAALAAGAINSIAGGGTLLTFPALLAAGLPPVTANATSSVSLVPGSFAAWWGYRGVESSARTLWALGIPSVVGGGAGALLLLWTGDALFGKLVPWLVLGATVLFIAQERLSRRIPHTAPLWTVIGFQFLVAIYGGFFGAGMGILMLAAHGYLGVRDIHQLNSIKNFCAVCINGVATATFVAMGRVVWIPALVMSIAAILGGYLGAKIARRVPATVVRKIVAGIGLGIAVLLFWRQFR
jgi:uncharacterized membrane protein YfcA